jgi:hypothetical protein
MPIFASIKKQLSFFKNRVKIRVIKDNPFAVNLHFSGTNNVPFINSTLNCMKSLYTSGTRYKNLVMTSLCKMNRFLLGLTFVPKDANIVRLGVPSSCSYSSNKGHATLCVSIIFANLTNMLFSTKLTSFIEISQDLSFILKMGTDMVVTTLHGFQGDILRYFNKYKENLIVSPESKHIQRIKKHASYVQK